MTKFSLLNHMPVISKLLISRKKTLHAIVKQPSNMHISQKFIGFKIMPILMPFKIRLVIFTIGLSVVCETADLDQIFHPDNLGLRIVRVVLPLIFFLKKN